MSHISIGLAVPVGDSIEATVNNLAKAIGSEVEVLEPTGYRIKPETLAVVPTGELTRGRTLHVTMEAVR